MDSTNRLICIRVGRTSHQLHYSVGRTWDGVESMMETAGWDISLWEDIYIMLSAILMCAVLWGMVYRHVVGRW